MRRIKICKIKYPYVFFLLLRNYTSNEGTVNVYRIPAVRHPDIPGSTLALIGGAIFLIWVSVLLSFNLFALSYAISTEHSRYGIFLYSLQLVLAVVILAISILSRGISAKFRFWYGYILLFLGIMPYIVFTVMTYLSPSSSYSIFAAFLVAVIGTTFDQFFITLGLVLVCTGAVQEIRWSRKTAGHS